MSPLNKMIGNKLKKVIKVEDYIQLFFCDGQVVNIFNNYKCSSEKLSALDGLVLKAVEENSDRIIFYFENKTELVVSLGDDDFNGPEAMTLKLDDSTFITWD